MSSDLSKAYGKMHVYLFFQGRQIRHLMPPLTREGFLEEELARMGVTRVRRVEVFGDMAFIEVEGEGRWRKILGSSV